MLCLFIYLDVAGGLKTHTLVARRMHRSSSSLPHKLSFQCRVWWISQVYEQANQVSGVDPLGGLRPFCLACRKGRRGLSDPVPVGLSVEGPISFLRWQWQPVPSGKTV